MVRSSNRSINNHAQHRDTVFYRQAPTTTTTTLNSHANTYKTQSTTRWTAILPYQTRQYNRYHCRPTSKHQPRHRIRPSPHHVRPKPWDPLRTMICPRYTPFEVRIDGRISGTGIWHRKDHRRYKRWYRHATRSPVHVTRHIMYMLINNHNNSGVLHNSIRDEGYFVCQKRSRNTLCTWRWKNIYASTTDSDRT